MFKIDTSQLNASFTILSIEKKMYLSKLKEKKNIKHQYQ